LNLILKSGLASKDKVREKTKPPALSLKVNSAIAFGATFHLGTFAVATNKALTLASTFTLQAAGVFRAGTRFFYTAGIRRQHIARQ